MASEPTLAAFQRAAVDHIVDRLRDRQGSRRFLLADEVGLGKTVVARGVIDRMAKGRPQPLDNSRLAYGLAALRRLFAAVTVMS